MEDNTLAVKNPFNGDIPDAVLEQWLNQFRSADRWAIARLLAHFRYYSSSKVFELLRNLHEKLMEKYEMAEGSTWFVPFGYVAKSGSAIAYMYRRANAIGESRFIATDSLDTVLQQNDLVIFLDDFIGSGKYGLKLWFEVIKPLKLSMPTVKFVFACIVGYERGLGYISENSELDVVVADVIPSTEQPFGENSVIFPDKDKRSKALKIVTKYGKRLQPDIPLGYADSQALLGFFFSTPNNTLPIFWSKEDGWRPLLPHGESLRDKDLLFGPPRGLATETVVRTHRRSLVELEQLAEYEIPVDTATRIFGLFQSTSVFLVFAPIIHDLAIPNDVFSHLASIIQRLQHTEHEKEPICTSIMIVGEDAGQRLQEKTFVKPQQADRIDDESIIEALASLVDGFEGALTFLHNGEILGNIMFPVDSDPLDSLLPKRYQAAAELSKRENSLLILFAGSNRISIFYCGERILSYRGATWHIYPQRLAQDLFKFAQHHDVAPTVLYNTFKIALEMADQGLGGLFTLGDEEAVLKLTDLPGTTKLLWSQLNVEDRDKRAIIYLAKQDGATLISKYGQVISGMAILHPPAGLEVEIEPGKGTRHDSAAKISFATNTLALVVSVSGLISLYSKGKPIFRIMG